jgi:hypothetical protein
MSSGRLEGPDCVKPWQPAHGGVSAKKSDLRSG